MFTVGAHMPLRDPRLPAALRSGAVAAGVVLLLGAARGCGLCLDRGSTVSAACGRRCPGPKFLGTDAEFPDEGDHVALGIADDGWLHALVHRLDLLGRAPSRDVRAEPARSAS
jgi:hypothetical protein